jgi:hypothetical protein
MAHRITEFLDFSHRSVLFGVEIRRSCFITVMKYVKFKNRLTKSELSPHYMLD